MLKHDCLRLSLLIGLLFAALLVTAAPALADNRSYSGELTTSDSLQDFGGGEAYYYDLYEFTVGDSGTYTLEADSADFAIRDDPIFALFAVEYDSGSPTSTIAYDDDSGPDYLPLIRTDLERCQRYVLLVSSYEVRDTGSYSLHISGPGSINPDECGGGDAGPIAGNLLDGRINRSQAFDVAAPVAVYCNDDGTFDVYAINADSGDGLLVFRSTLEQMTAAAPAEQATLSSEHGVWVYRLTDGSFQIHAGYFDGKPYWFSFDTCPPTWTYTTPPA